MCDTASYLTENSTKMTFQTFNKRNAIFLFWKINAYFEFHASNTFQKSWDGACLPLCCITSSFKNTVNVWQPRRPTAGGLKEKCCPFQQHFTFRGSTDLLCRIFHFIMHQMFQAGDRCGLQAGEFSTWTPLLRIHAVDIHAESSLALSC